MTLCQYYDREVKKNGYNSWNHFCAKQKENNLSIDWYKKQLKSDYKKQFPDKKPYLKKEN